MKDIILNNKHSGFFLFELLIAIGIFSLTCILVAQFHSTLNIQTLENKNYLEALNLASSIIEESAIVGNFKTIKKGIFTINFLESPNLINFNNQTQANQKEQTKSKTRIFKLNKIIITWNSLKGKERVISLNYGIII